MVLLFNPVRNISSKLVNLLCLSILVLAISTQISAQNYERHKGYFLYYKSSALISIDQIENTEFLIFLGNQYNSEIDTLLKYSLIDLPRFNKELLKENKVFFDFQSFNNLKYTQPSIKINSGFIDTLSSIPNFYKLIYINNNFYTIKSDEPAFILTIGVIYLDLNLLLFETNPEAKGCYKVVESDEGFLHFDKRQNEQYVYIPIKL